MNTYKRIFTIVIDSLGAGAMPDALAYGDVGSDTLSHIDTAFPYLHIPNLQLLGLANLHSMIHVVSLREPIGYYTKMLEKSIGKDTITGHWEMMGLYTTKPFITFTENGFPKQLLDELSRRTGHTIVGNKAASGTAILDEFGEHQIKTGDLIVYTSADSVLQICGHEETMGLNELYRCCQIARELTMKPEWNVGRVIARPYQGWHCGEFKRTANRHDYALKPFNQTVLDVIIHHGYDVIGIGKICDIFNGEGIRESYPSQSSVHGIGQMLEHMNIDFQGLCFVNLVDFDALWGHRRNPIGYGEEINRFDVLLGDVISKLREDDLLMITADHGNDPTFNGSDHTREMVPLLVYSPSMQGHGLLPVCESFADIGATIAENFHISMPEGTIGKSFAYLLK